MKGVLLRSKEAGLLTKIGAWVMYALAAVVLFAGGRAWCTQKMASGWYESEPAKHGFYWYEKKPSKPKKKRPKKQKKPVRHSLNELLSMDTEKLRKTLQAALNEAVSKPTVENVAYYMLVQDAIRRKALAFTNVYMLTLQKHPELAPASYAVPVNNPGRRAVYALKEEEINSTLKSASSQFGLIFFEKHGCPYCEAQDNILKMFEVDWGWRVKRVFVDDHPDLAQRFKVDLVPYILLVCKETGNYMPVSVGVVALDELEIRIVRAIRYLRGQVSPQEFTTPAYQLEAEKKSAKKSSDLKSILAQ